MRSEQPCQSTSVDTSTSNVSTIGHAGGESFTNSVVGPPSTTPGHWQGLRTKRLVFSNFSVECPWRESNPWGSVLRVNCVTLP
jgi:hypothetical protein